LEKLHHHVSILTTLLYKMCGYNSSIAGVNGRFAVKPDSGAGLNPQRFQALPHSQSSPGHLDVSQMIKLLRTVTHDTPMPGIGADVDLAISSSKCFVRNSIMSLPISGLPVIV
jgi:hypothetical protein